MARLDTGWHEHPKILALGWAAMGLHAWSISYCDANTTDGFVPFHAWPSLPGAPRIVQQLVTAGLWEPSERGYQLHDYSDYNRTKAQIEAERAEDRARKADHRRNGKLPDSGRTTAGQSQDSERIPRAPGPGPGPGVPTGRPVNPPNPPLASLAGGPDVAPPRAAAPHEEPDVLHPKASVCPFCRVPFMGTYLDHTAEKHRVNQGSEPGNLDFGKLRRDTDPAPPPPEIAAEFDALHQRLQQQLEGQTNSC